MCWAKIKRPEFLRNALNTFLAGFFLTNTIPHFVSGVTGGMFPSPLASLPGVGLSTPVENVIWGSFSLLLGFLFLRASKAKFENNKAMAMMYLGIVVCGLILASVFGAIPKEVAQTESSYRPEMRKLIDAVDGQRVHQIRCGDHRFIDMTIVQTEGRFFVRQYKFSKRSWRTAFLESPSENGEANGAMKIGDLEVAVVGKVPDDLEEINPKVNRAHNKLLGLAYPAMRLTYDTEKHEASTLELVPVLGE